MTERKSLYQLDMLLHQASVRYKTGSFWRHKSGDVYEVTGHSARESTGEIEILYRPARSGDGYVLRCVNGSAIDSTTGEAVFYHLSFHRPIEEWEQEIDEAIGLSRARRRYEPVHKATVFRDGHPSREY